MFLLKQLIVSPFVHTLAIISLFAADLEDPKIGIRGKEITCIQRPLKGSNVSGL